jgi:hypothetical protein
MTEERKSAAVVAGWFAGNAVLAGLLPAFGEISLAVTLYACATALPAATAVLLLVYAGPNHDAERRFSLAGQGIWVVPAALGLVLVGIGSFAGVFLVWIGGLAVLGSCIQLLRGSLQQPEVPDGAA